MINLESPARLVRFALGLLLLLASPAAFAQPDEPADAVDDIENAPTPTSILDLLPEDDKGWPKDFWLIATMSDGGGEGDQVYMGWSAKRLDDGVELGLSIGDSDRLAETKLTYGPNGKVRGFSSRETRAGNTRTTLGTGLVEGDEFVLTQIRLREGREPQTSTTRTPMAVFDSAYPLELLPLVVGYHARQGNLGYELPVIIMDDRRVDVELLASVEDVGAEQAEVDGEDASVHVLLATVREDPGQDDDDVFSMSFRFTSRGGFVDLSMEAHGMKITAERVTREEVVEAFGLDENQEPGVDADEAADAAAEAVEE